MMEDLLYCKDLYLPLRGDVAKPQEKSDVDWSILHRKTVGYIRQWVDQSVYHHVAQETRADVLWKKLESMYERQTALNKTSLIRRVVNLKYREGSNMTEHLNDFQGLVNQLTAMKLVLEDEIQALLLLSSLPESWETLVVSVSNSAPNGTLTLAMVKDSLINEEARRKDLGIGSDSRALVTDKSERRGRSKHRGNKYDRSEKSKGRSKSRGKKNLKCFYCDKPGHFKRDCRLWKKK